MQRDLRDSGSSHYSLPFCICLSGVFLSRFRNALVFWPLGKFSLHGTWGLGARRGTSDEGLSLGLHFVDLGLYLTLWNWWWTWWWGGLHLLCSALMSCVGGFCWVGVAYSFYMLYRIWDFPYIWLLLIITYSFFIIEGFFFLSVV